MRTGFVSFASAFGLGFVVMVFACTQQLDAEGVDPNASASGTEVAADSGAPLEEAAPTSLGLAIPDGSPIVLPKHDAGDGDAASPGDGGGDTADGGKKKYGGGHGDGGKHKKDGGKKHRHHRDRGFEADPEADDPDDLADFDEENASN